MSDPLDLDYNTTVGTNRCLPVGSGPVWVDEPLYTFPEEFPEEATAVVVGIPELPGAMEVTDTDPASITLVIETHHLLLVPPRDPHLHQSN
jgi:hypothetical protein